METKPVIILTYSNNNSNVILSNIYVDENNLNKIQKGVPEIQNLIKKIYSKEYDYHLEPHLVKDRDIIYLFSNQAVNNSNYKMSFDSISHCPTSMPVNKLDILLLDFIKFYKLKNGILDEKFIEDFNMNILQNQQNHLLQFSITELIKTVYLKVKNNIFKNEKI